MQIIPVQAVPNQTFSILLANQSCQITLTTRFFGLYFDLAVSNVLVRAGVVCQNLNPIIRYPYLGFIGDFWFMDTQGEEDPTYVGLGNRFLLQYLEQSDLVGGLT